MCIPCTTDSLFVHRFMTKLFKYNMWPFMFSSYLSTILCCIMVNFSCLGRHFCPLELVKIYNVWGNGKLIFITNFHLNGHYWRGKLICSTGRLLCSQILFTLPVCNFNTQEVTFIGECSFVNTKTHVCAAWFVPLPFPSHILVTGVVAS